MRKAANPGILQQIRDNSTYKHLSIELIEEHLRDIFYGKAPDKTVRHPLRTPSVTKHEWEQDGKLFYMWKIDTGESVAWTNDAGKKQFDDALMKAGFTIPEHLKTKPES